MAMARTRSVYINKSIVTHPPLPKDRKERIGRNLQAPPYPGLVNAEAQLTTPKVSPTNQGDSEAPKTCSCLGSRPIPKARNISVKQQINSRMRACSADTSAVSTAQPPTTKFRDPYAVRSIRPAKVPPRIWPVIYKTMRGNEISCAVKVAKVMVGLRWAPLMEANVKVKRVRKRKLLMPPTTGPKKTAVA